jgi:hypothetical protein
MLLCILDARNAGAQATVSRLDDLSSFLHRGIGDSSPCHHVENDYGTDQTSYLLGGRSSFVGIRTVGAGS